MKLDSSTVSPSNPYFISEAGVNHNGDIEMALDLVDAAVAAGADAVKFQTFSADRLVTRSDEPTAYQSTESDVESQYELLKQYEFDRNAHRRLRDYCQAEEITFLSTPFDAESADLLANLGVPAFKVGSGELTNIPLLRHIAELGRPMIVSTGMATMDEIQEARTAITQANPDVDTAFLHCTSAYPCAIEDVNLQAMETMRAELDAPIGYSDHTTRVEMPAFAVSAGAAIVEKHFTLDSALPGPDHAASLEPDELKRAVELVKTAARARGTGEKSPVTAELENMPHVRKSLHAAADIPAGERLRPDQVAVIRPLGGLAPKYLDDVVGARTRYAIEEGAPITKDDITDVELDDGETT